MATNVKWPTFGHKGVGHNGYNPCTTIYYNVLEKESVYDDVIELLRGKVVVQEVVLDRILLKRLGPPLPTVNLIPSMTFLTQTVT